MTIWFVEKSGKRRKGVCVICAFCKKEFLTREGQEGQCCSIDCKIKLRTALTTKEVACAWCGAITRKKLSKLKNSKSGLYFCDRYCKEKAQRIGGIREIMPQHYGTSISYKNILKEVETPNCVGCPETRKYLLCVHHIDGNHDNDEIDNLEIVCWNCHVKRHLKFEDGTWIYSPHVLTPRDMLDKL